MHLSFRECEVEAWIVATVGNFIYKKNLNRMQHIMLKVSKIFTGAWCPAQRGQVITRSRAGRLMSWASSNCDQIYMYL